MCLLHLAVLTACVFFNQVQTLQAAIFEFASDKEATWNEIVLSTHNHPRLQAGLPPFQWNNALAGVAREWLKSDMMSVGCDTSTVVHSSKDFRTEHPESPFYYLGETAVSKELPPQAEPWDAVQLARQAVSRWGDPIAQNISYGRWGSKCTVDKVRIATVKAGQEPGLTMAIAEGFFQSLWAETREVGCEAAFCGISDNQTFGNETWKTFLFVCEYGPGGNVRGELPFSPTTATILGLSSSPCDGPLSDSEWLHWERWDTKNYPLPSGHTAANSAGDLRRSLHAAVVLIFLIHAATYRKLSFMQDGDQL